MRTFRRILCPVDFSRVSVPAIELTLDLASQSGGQVLLFCAVPPPDADQSRQELERSATDQLRAIARKWLESHVPCEIVVRFGEPAASILDAEKELRVDAVVMATHGRTGAEYVTLGSVTERVVRESICPVITTRPH
ncbi:MAG TPA: universal stress protein [Candidatus Binataceae bacterium]|nr:universal stress protein [Candidatus Binataceae bacterium]